MVGAFGVNPKRRAYKCTVGTNNADLIHNISKGRIFVVLVI